MILHFLHELPLHIAYIRLLSGQLLSQEVILTIEKLVIVSKGGEVVTDSVEIGTSHLDLVVHLTRLEG